MQKLAFISFAIFFCFTITKLAHSSEIFIDNKDGTITDSETGLMWQKDLPFFSVDTCDAEIYCKNLNIGNNKNWTLPTKFIFDDFYVKKDFFPKKITGKYCINKIEDKYNRYYYDFDTNIDDSRTNKKYCRDLKAQTRCVMLASKDNIVSPQEFLEAKKLNITVNEFKEWKNVIEKFGAITYMCKTSDLYCFEYINEWTSRGFKPSEAFEWFALGDIDEAKRWKDNGFLYDEAMKWKKIQLNSDQAKGWRDSKIEADIAKKWLDEKSSLQDAIDWRGFEAHDSTEWKKLGFSRDEAIKWRAFDNSPSVAQEWRNRNFDVMEAEKWRTLDFNPENAVQWKNAGKQPEDVGVWHAYPPEVASILKQYCNNEVKDFMALAKMNPYDTKNQCFYLYAPMLQLLSKSKALYSLSNITFALDFNGKSAETGVFEGFIFGKGVYQYQNVLGAKQIVPLFEEISITQNNEESKFGK